MSYEIEIENLKANVAFNAEKIAELEQAYQEMNAMVVTMRAVIESLQSQANPE